MEYSKEFKQKNNTQMEAEFGDILFALINYARFNNINPEDALERTNQKFIKRFKYIENQAHKQNISIDNVDIETMNAFWEESKKHIK